MRVQAVKRRELALFIPDNGIGFVRVPARASVAVLLVPRAVDRPLVFIRIQQIAFQAQFVEQVAQAERFKVALVVFPPLRLFSRPPRFALRCNFVACRIFKPKPFLQLQPRDRRDAPKHLPPVDMTVFVRGRGQHKV